MSNTTERGRGFKIEFSLALLTHFRSNERKSGVGVPLCPEEKTLSAYLPNDEVQSKNKNYTS